MGVCAAGDGPHRGLWCCSLAGWTALMPLSDPGMIQRRMFEACSSVWLHPTDIFARYRGWTEPKETKDKWGYASRGYASTYSHALSELVRLGYLETTLQVRHARTDGMPSRPAKMYRRKKDVYYNTRKNPRYDYRDWAELDSGSQESAGAYYDDTYAWLQMDDFVYPVTKARYHNGYKPTLIKVERVLRITVEEAEMLRGEWIQEKINDRTTD